MDATLQDAQSWATSLTLAALTVAISAGLVGLGCRGSDLPAQLFRADLFSRAGFVVWDNQWFGGHATLPYSILAPAVSAALGPIVVSVLSGGISAILFDRISRSAFTRSRVAASAWFASSMVTNVVIGRATFALGVTLGLASVLCLQRRRRLPGLVCAACCSAASPVAGVFLAVGAAGWWLAERSDRRLAAGTAAAALMPLAVVGLLFPGSGAFPYEPWAISCDLAICATCMIVLPTRFRIVRRVALVYGVVACAVFLVPSPLGGNISRLGQYAAGPILVGTFGWRRRWMPLLAAPLLFWQWFPAVDSLAFARHDPSTEAHYYQPLLRAIRSRPGPPGRTEIPFTYRHWETYFAGRKLLLARGWERQLDMAYNPIFYRALSAASYRQWLHDNGVRFVALPDVRLDDSSTRERALLQRQLTFLAPIWHDEHWRLFQVRHFHGLADGGATVTDISDDRFTVTMVRPGPITIRVRASEHWAVRGPGCVAASPDGWVRLHAFRAGRLVIQQALRTTPCTTREPGDGVRSPG